LAYYNAAWKAYASSIFGNLLIGFDDSVLFSSKIS